MAKACFCPEREVDDIASTFVLPSFHFHPLSGLKRYDMASKKLAATAYPQACIDT